MVIFKKSREIKFWQSEYSKKIDELKVELTKLHDDVDLFFEHFDMIENKLRVRGRDPRLQKKVDELRKDENE